MYFDPLVIKFDDNFVEQGDPIKGGALMVFRRIFSSTMRAEDGFAIDKDGQVPEVYAERQAASEFEKGPLATLLGPCQRRKAGEGARRPGDPRRRAPHACGARPGLRDLPEVNRRSHHHTGNADGAAVRGMNRCGGRGRDSG